MGDIKDFTDGVSWMQDHGHSIDNVSRKLITDIGKLTGGYSIDPVSAQLMDWEGKGMYPQIRRSRITEQGGWKCFFSLGAGSIIAGYGASPLGAVNAAKEILRLNLNRTRP